jgi:light-regulated signal transduction histidine kinase (bacteriophytochrome)
MMLEVCWDDLKTLSIRLSQFHGHGSLLVCEVALRYLMQLSKEILGIIGRDPSVPSHNQLHVLRYIL